MRFAQPASPASVTTSVWAAATRKITQLANVLTVSSELNKTIAASATISFTAAGGLWRLYTIVVKAAAAGTIAFNYFDGTNTFAIQTIAAGTVGVLQNALVDAATGVFVKMVNNDAANAAVYMDVVILVV